MASRNGKRSIRGAGGPGGGGGDRVGQGGGSEEEGTGVLRGAAPVLGDRGLGPGAGPQRGGVDRVRDRYTRGGAGGGSVRRVRGAGRGQEPAS